MELRKLAKARNDAGPPAEAVGEATVEPRPKTKQKKQTH